MGEISTPEAPVHPVAGLRVPPPPRTLIGIAAWVGFGLFAAANLYGLMAEQTGLCRIAQPLAAAFLLLAFVASVRTWSTTTVLATVGVALAWIGDTLPPHLPVDTRLGSALAFGLAMVAYAAALWPLWLQVRDSLRMLMAVPYAGVVIGLYIACFDGAGDLAVPVLLYAVALAAMAFLAAGVNSLTWVGGTLFLLSSSVLGMSWFLSGAWVPHHEVWIMASYFLGHAFLLAGILRAAPRAPEASALPASGGATLVIVD